MSSPFIYARAFPHRGALVYLRARAFPHRGALVYLRARLSTPGRANWIQAGRAWASTWSLVTPTIVNTLGAFFWCTCPPFPPAVGRDPPAAFTFDAFLHSAPPRWKPLYRRPCARHC